MSVNGLAGNETQNDSKIKMKVMQIDGNAKKIKMDTAQGDQNKVLNGKVEEKEVVENGNDFQRETYMCGSCNLTFKTMRILRKHNCDIPVDNTNRSEGETEKTNATVKTRRGKPKSVVQTGNEGKEKDEENPSTEKKRQCEKKHTCPGCGKKYVKKQHMVRHLAAHFSKGPWKCTECDKEYVSSFKFKEHCLEHGITKPFICRKCNGSFTTADVLRVHDRVHTGERPFACNVCEKRFKQSSNLQDHLRAHKNEREFICGTCGKSFNIKGDLTRHLMLHSGTRTFPCHLCAKSFPTVSNLNRHIRTHMGDKPFPCSYCNKSFARRERLQEHERTHTGEKPFVCKECGKSFSDSGNFSNHKKAHLGPDMKKCKRFPKSRFSSSGVDPARNGSIIAVMENCDTLLNMEDNAEEKPITTEELNEGDASTPAEGLYENQGKQQIMLSLPVCYLDQSNAEIMVCYVGSPSQQSIPSTSNQQIADQSLVMQLHNISKDTLLSPVSSAMIDTSTAAQEIPDGKGRPEKTSCDDLYAKSTIDSICTENDAVKFPDSLLVADSATENSPKTKITPTKLTTATEVKTPTKALSASKHVGSDGEYETPRKSTGTIKSRKGDDQELINSDKFQVGATIKGPPEAYQGQQTFLLNTNGDVPDHFYASSLTLTDLVKVDEVPSYSYQPGYFIDGEQRKFGEILVVTPTKSYPEERSQSSSALICSQVLVTPEHASKRPSYIDRSKIKPRALEL